MDEKVNQISIIVFLISLINIHCMNNTNDNHKQISSNQTASNVFSNNLIHAIRTLTYDDAYNYDVTLLMNCEMVKIKVIWMRIRR